MPLFPTYLEDGILLLADEVTRDNRLVVSGMVQDVSITVWGSGTIKCLFNDSSAMFGMLVDNKVRWLLGLGASTFIYYDEKMSYVMRDDIVSSYIDSLITRHHTYIDARLLYISAHVTDHLIQMYGLE